MLITWTTWCPEVHVYTDHYGLQKYIVFTIKDMKDEVVVMVQNDGMMTVRGVNVNVKVLDFSLQ